MTWQEASDAVMAELYAHTPSPTGKWHSLADHLREVARLAAEHASAFGAGDLAWWAGILHDAGKASPEFQRYLRLCHEQPDRKHPTTDHKGAGFLRAIDVCEPLALLIQAHHGGLIDSGTLREKFKATAARSKELRVTLARYDELGLIPTDKPFPDLAPIAKREPAAIEFALRMLFSALVDADHLDSERHRNREDFERRGGASAITNLWETFQSKQDAFVAALDPSAVDSEVNRVRAEVYAACLAAAEGQPGFYRLTVPTGGGKTRSGFAFALKHAELRELRRVIVAVPYLTITDQTAKIARDIFPDERIVLEHHSAAGEPIDDEQGPQEERERWRRLAAEDWDAPLIITTMVQLFESLLGRKTTVCRKLHRIAKSVIILDEAQTIPPTLRGPIFSVLHELVANYGVTVVLCTATQPAIDTLPMGLKPTEIVPDPARHFRTLERVTYRWPGVDEPKWRWEDAADRMRGAEQALAIVNTVANAQTLFSTLGDDEGHFHLSARKCGAHRRDVLALVRERLKDKQRCRLVSTQVIEAGLDLDFPLLLRALGPLDRIVQAAGRCNREGRLADKGEVVVFDPDEDGMPPGPYRSGTDTTKLLRRMLLGKRELDLNDPTTFSAYFAALNRIVPADAPGIQGERAKLNYEQVAVDFRLIDQDQASILVRYRGLGWDERRDGSGLVDQLVRDLETAIRTGNSKWLRLLLRRAQPFLVSVRKREIERHVHETLARELTTGLYLWFPTYDDKLGLVSGRGDIGALIAE